MTPEAEVRLGQISEKLVALQEQLRRLRAEEGELVQERDFVLYGGWTRTNTGGDWICLESPGKGWAINAGRYSCRVSLWRREPDGYSTQQGEDVLLRRQEEFHLGIGSDEQLGQDALRWAKERISQLKAEQVDPDSVPQPETPASELKDEASHD